MFTIEEIQNILNIIDYHSSFIVANSLGKEILTEYDKFILRNNGIDIDTLLNERETSYYEMYMWGRLSSLLQNNQSSQISYKDFEKYIKTGQYISLTKQEQYNYNLSKQKTYEHIKGLGTKIKKDVNILVAEKSNLSRKEYEKIIGNEIKEGVLKRKTITNIVSEIGDKTKDWTKDWSRIVETEMNNIFQQGRADSILNKKGGEAKVFKEVYPKACKHCIKHYLTNGVGSQPRLFTLQQLIDNGNNFGKKTSEWKPVLESMHPYCRCTLRELPEGYVWDEEKQIFIPSKENKIKRSSKIIVTVGNKKFKV